MSEFLRGVAPFMQPKPARNPGGDCFACALTAAVRSLYPDRPLAFDSAWECFKAKNSSGDEVVSNSWGSFEAAVWRLRELGYPLEFRRDIITPRVDLSHWSHAWWFAIPDGEWAYRLEAWLSAGWIALAEMELDGKGPYTPEGCINVIDHFVVLDGQRIGWESMSGGGQALEYHTHVVCSAKGAYWMRTRELLLKHGVAGLTLIRRDAR